MPKKTKKEKIRASTHREEFQFQFQATPQAHAGIHTANSDKEMMLIAQDLLKTVLLAGCVIAFELLLTRIIK